jgi:hypothetical protein
VIHFGPVTSGKFIPYVCNWILERNVQADLRQDLARECDRFSVKTPHHLIPPDLERTLEPVDFSIWCQDPLVDDLAQTLESNPLEELLTL